MRKVYWCSHWHLICEALWQREFKYSSFSLSSCPKERDWTNATVNEIGMRLEWEWDREVWDSGVAVTSRWEQQWALRTAGVGTWENRKRPKATWSRQTYRGQREARSPSRRSQGRRGKLNSVSQHAVFSLWYPMGSRKDPIYRRKTEIGTGCCYCFNVYG